MGGSESAGGLHVDVETPNLQAGGQVTGVIHLLVKVPTPASTLVLVFKGKEKTEWSMRYIEPTKTGIISVRTHTYTGKSYVLKQRFPIFSFALGRLNPGQFSFPFSITIPPDLPSSFNYHASSLDSGPTIATLQYKLVAKMEGEGVIIKEGERELYITRIMAAPVMSIADQVSARISTWCCISKGTIRLNAHFNKNAYVPGEIATVILDVDNQESKVTGTGFKLTLYRTLQLKSNHLKSHFIKEPVNSVVLAGSVASKKGMLTVDQKTLQLLIPTSAEVALATSTKGSLIECLYSVSGEIVMDGCCMCYGEKPVIEKTMLIYPPQMQRQPLPPAPEGWNPKVMQMQQFTTGSEYDYASSTAQE